MPKNSNLVLLASIVGTAVVFTGAGFMLASGKANLPSQMLSFSKTSPDILLLTNPVTSFSGKIEKVSGDSILVSQKVSSNQMFQAGAAAPVNQKPGEPPAALPTPVVKTLTYKVKVTQNTQINMNQSFIPYLTVSVTPVPPPKLTLQNLKVGQNISIQSAADLRTITNNEFEAQSITLSITNSFSGKISSVKNNTITVKGNLMGVIAAAPGSAGEQPKEIEWTVKVTDKTEISRYKQISEMLKPGETAKAPEVEKLSLSDLKPDTMVTVYTNVDAASEKSVEALRIEPQAAPLVQQVAPPISGAPPIQQTAPSLSGAPNLKNPPGTPSSYTPPLEK